MKRPFVRTLLTVAVLIGLGAYVYFVDSKLPDSDEEAKEKVFADFDSETATALTLSPRTGVRIRVAREGEAWKLTEPQQVAADASAVESLLGSIANLEVDATIAEGETDLAQYGLESPRVRVEVERESGATPVTLEIGDKAPAGGGVYARVPDQGRVVTVASHLETTFDKEPFDLRDRDLVKVERDDIVAIDVEGPGATFGLERVADERWLITAPVRTRGSRWPVDGLVGNIANLKMEAVANEKADDFAPYGLDPPVWRVRAKLRNEAEVVIAFGSSPEDGKHHVRVGDASLVAVTDDALVGDLEKGLDGLRAKRLVEASTYQVVGFDAVLDGQSHTFERQGEDEAEQSWKRTSPDAADLEADVVQDVLYGLGGIDAVGFVDAPEAPSAYGLDAPALRLVLRVEGEGGEEWVELGRNDAGVWARRSDDASVLELEAAALDELLAELKKITGSEPASPTDAADAPAPE